MPFSARENAVESFKNRLHERKKNGSICWVESWSQLKKARQ